MSCELADEYLEAGGGGGGYKFIIPVVVVEKVL